MKRKLWGVLFIIILSFAYGTKVHAGFKYIGLKETENGAYDVLIWVTEESVEVQEVTVTEGGAEKKLLKSPLNSIYKLDGLVGVPTKVTIRHKDGTTLDETFLEKPAVSFRNGYSTNASIYREDVLGDITASGDLFYTVSHVTKGCSSSPCSFTISENGLLTVIHDSGIKRTSVGFRIGNINKKELRLFLEGKRENTYQLSFKWNYPLQSGEIDCSEGSQNRKFTISPNTTSFSTSGFNTNYTCTLTGRYQETELSSNEISIARDQTQPISGDSDFSQVTVQQNVYVEESRVGTSYFINVRRSNTDSNEALIPVILFD